MSGDAPTVTLPPALYWSATLARHLNRTAGPDAQHGLIDATVATVLLHWTTDAGGWSILLRELPADAVRLVAEREAGAVTTVIVRLAELEHELTRLRTVEQAARAWATEWADSGGHVSSIEPAAAHLAGLVDET